MNPSAQPPAHTPLATVDADHPWLGLSAFTGETQRYFFGRDAEISEIFVRVRDNTLTILYGQSGRGKSSLLGAGLIPKLQVENHRPVELRLRYHKEAPPLVDQVFAELEKADLLGSRRPDNLWEWLHHPESQPADLHASPPVLIFDQFEEIFTLGHKPDRLEQTHELLTQLAGFIENRTPALLRARFREDRSLARNFDNTPTPARIVITLRADYLFHLEKWKNHIPSLMRNRMGLDLLNGTQALEAVVLPGRLEGRNLVDEEVAASIVRLVAKDESNLALEKISAIPPFLSLVCDELNRLRIAQGLPTITAALVESQSKDILKTFYTESFTGLPTAVRRYIEQFLVTREGGHRTSASHADAIAHLRNSGVEDPAAALSRLITRRLITPEERGGVLWLEITHDVLAPEVVRSRDERLEKEQLLEIENRLAEEKSIIRKRRKHLIQFMALSLFFTVVAMILLAYAREAQLQAQSAKEKARRLEEEAAQLKTTADEIQNDASKGIIVSTGKNESKQQEPDLPDASAITPIVPDSEKEKRLPFLVKPAKPGSLLDDLGLQTFENRESITRYIKTISGFRTPTSLKLLSLLHLIEGAHLKDEGKLNEAIQHLSLSLEIGKEASEVIPESEKKEFELLLTRTRSRLADIHLDRKTPEEGKIAEDLYYQCITEAQAHAKKWDESPEGKIHYYKTRIARALAIQNPPGTPQWGEASRLLQEGIAHKRRFLEQKPLATPYDTDQSLTATLAATLATSGEIARIDIMDYPLATKLYRESYQLQSTLPPGKQPDAALQEALISKIWHFSQALLQSDPQSKELESLLEDGIRRSDWMVRNEPQKLDSQNLITNIAVFQMIRMQVFLLASEYDGALKPCTEAIHNFTRALELRLESGKTNPDGAWLVNQQQLLSWYIIEYWTRLKLGAHPELHGKIEKMDSLIRKLSLRELDNQPGDADLSYQAALVHERSYAFAASFPKPDLTMDSAKKAAALYLDYAEKFQATIPRAKAWGYSGASAATRQIALLLSETPPRYAASMIENEDRESMFELSLRYSETSVDAALAQPGKPDLAGSKTRHEFAVDSYRQFLESPQFTTQDRRKLARRVFEKTKLIYEKAPSSAYAYQWAICSTYLQHTYWRPSPSDLPEAEQLARTTYDTLEKQSPSFAGEFNYLIARVNAGHSLATLLGHQYDAAESVQQRTKLAGEAVRIWQESTARTEALLRTATQDGNKETLKICVDYLIQGYETMIPFYKKLDTPAGQMAELEKRLQEIKALIK